MDNKTLQAKIEQALETACPHRTFKVRVASKSVKIEDTTGTPEFVLNVDIKDGVFSQAVNVNNFVSPAKLAKVTLSGCNFYGSGFHITSEGWKHFVSQKMLCVLRALNPQPKNDYVWCFRPELGA